MNKFTNSEEETILFAENFARNLKSGDVVLLSGELGSGKTTFIKGIARAIGIDQDEIKSPSFVIMNLYEGRIPLYHFDLYRLENNEDINDLGFEEFFESGGISVIEWAERSKDIISNRSFRVVLDYSGDNTRKITITRIK